MYRVESKIAITTIALRGPSSQAHFNCLKPVALIYLVVVCIHYARFKAAQSTVCNIPLVPMQLV